MEVVGSEVLNRPLQRDCAPGDVSTLNLYLSACLSVSGVAAVCEQQTDSGSVSADEGQRSCCLLSAARRRSVQPPLVGRLSVRRCGRSAGTSRSRHPHSSAEESDQHQPTAAARRQPTERVRTGSSTGRVRTLLMEPGHFLTAVAFVLQVSDHGSEQKTPAAAGVGS